jgi:hypothetical protein
MWSLLIVANNVMMRISDGVLLMKLSQLIPGKTLIAKILRWRAIGVLSSMLFQLLHREDTDFAILEMKVLWVILYCALQPLSFRLSRMVELGRGECGALLACRVDECSNIAGSPPTYFGVPSSLRIQGGACASFL